MPRNPAALLIHFFSIALILLLFGQPPALTQDASGQPKITGAHFVFFQSSEADIMARFRLAIEGEHLPSATEGVSIAFDTTDPSHPIICKPETCTPFAADGKELLLDAAVKGGTEVSRIRVFQNGRLVAESKDCAIEFKEKPPEQAIKHFEVKLEHEKNKEFPNIHTVILTKAAGEGGFDNRPLRMSVELTPGGATDITIVPPSNPDHLVVRFVAAPDYEPAGAVVTVYNNTDLATREATAIATVAKQPEDPDEPKVDHPEIVFINRSHGVGRIRIVGKNFGEYDPPPYQVDDYLWNCLEEFHIRGTERYALGTENLEYQDIEQRIAACEDILKGKIAVQDDLGKGRAFLDSKYQEHKKRIEANEEPRLKQREEDTKVNMADFLRDVPKETDALKWAADLRQKVTFSLRSRNPDIQVERVEIININDKMIDVYFEFARARGYSYPLRLESSVITIKKQVKKIVQSAKNDKTTATITCPKDQIYSVPYEIEPKRDVNLTYKYTILDDHSANTLVGKGVADNFRVIQLSVVNKGKKKVAVPLAAIQAEAEWVRGEKPGKPGGKKNLTGLPGAIASTGGWIFGIDPNSGKGVSFKEGPPTVAPIPLAAVASYFEAYQKVKGKRAIWINTLEAATTAATALVPFVGPSFKDAEVYFSGGFVPAFKKAWGDLSSQQLQVLTSQSWQTTETLSAEGGSMEKLIYIQKKDQRFKADKQVTAAGLPDETVFQLARILGLEVTGYEITESEAKSATPEDKNKQPKSDGKEGSTPKPESPPKEESTTKNN